MLSMDALVSNRLSFGDGHHHAETKVKVSIRGLNVWYDYGGKLAIKNVDLNIFDDEVTAFIGPSGCGKSTILKCLNRMTETITGVTITGDILIDGARINDSAIEVCKFRNRIGWVAQTPNPFPRSIYENVAYGARINGFVDSKAEADAFVEQCLLEANLWEEMKDQLLKPGNQLSGGQQQRLCIARALSTKPEIILMDEPCSALDPNATSRVEDLIGELRKSHAIVIVTHNMQQAARVSQRVAYFHLGEMLECGDTEEVMSRPKTQKCHDYITGRFG
jgi:phosphate transport system ATP-binding protein